MHVLKLFKITRQMTCWCYTITSDKTITLSNAALRSMFAMMQNWFSSNAWAIIDCITSSTDCMTVYIFYFSHVNQTALFYWSTSTRLQFSTWSTMSTSIFNVLIMPLNIPFEIQTLKSLVFRSPLYNWTIMQTLSLKHVRIFPQIWTFWYLFLQCKIIHVHVRT